MDVQKIVEAPKLGQFDEFSPGDLVAVELTVAEGDRQRLQLFRGNVIRGAYRRNKPPAIGSSFIVRRVSYGIGVERTIPFHSPLVKSVKLIRSSAVRRARIYYLRDLTGKKARLKAKAN